MSKYYVLLERFTGETWAQSFGDYDKETVKDEMIDCKDSGCYRGEIYKVITVNGDTQADIENAIAKENSKLTDLTPAETVKAVKRTNKAQAMVNAFDLFDYENLDCSGRDEVIADLVAILWPDLKDQSMVAPLMDYIQNLFDDRLAIIEQNCHNPRFESRTFN